VLREIAGIVHEADLAAERYDAPEAPGLDVLLRGLSMICGDAEVLALTRPLFDGLSTVGRCLAASCHDHLR